nr:hypothetical protein [Tanacetum cinerariifolium]
MKNNATTRNEHAMRNSGNAGRNNRRAYVQEEVVEGSNETGNVQRTLRNSSLVNTLTVQCYNYSGKGHYARNCPKPRVRDSKYFMEQMLLAKQDEAGVILADEQNKNSGNAGRNNRRAYVQEEVVEGSNETDYVQRTLRNLSLVNTLTVQCYNYSGKGHYARNCPKPRVRDSKYFMEQMFLAKQDEAGVILADEQNEFLFADASRMEEIKDLSANICLWPEFNQPITLLMLGQAMILLSHIIFDTPNGNVNSDSVEKDTHVSNICALEQLARNAYQEAEKQQIFSQKVQKQNKTLTSQLELYKERVRVLEIINEDNNYLNEFL